MITMLIVALTTVTATIAPPLHLQGEATLSEIAHFLRAEHGLVLEVPESLADRPLFFHWEPQSEAMLMKGLSTALGLKAVKDEDKKVWRFLVTDALQSSEATKRIERYVNASMKFKLGLLALSEAEVTSLRREVASQRRPDLVNSSAGTAQASLYTFPAEVHVLGLLSTLGRNEFGTDFTQPFEPKNSIAVAQRQLEPYTIAFNQNWGLIDPGETIGNPTYLIAPHIVASRYTYTLLAVYANTSRVLGNVHMSLFRDQSGFEFETNESFDRKLTPKPVYLVSNGRSFELLPDLFRQLKISFATWCPRSSISSRWSAFGSSVSIAELVRSTRVASANKEDSERYAFSVDVTDGWTQVKYVEQVRFRGTGANWTKFLPVARRVRKGEVSVHEVLEFASALSDREAREISEARLDRADLPFADIQLSQGIMLLRAVASWKDGVELLSNSDDVRAKISGLPEESKRSIEKFLRTSRFWPYSAHFHHQDFKKLMNSYTLRVRYDRSGGEAWLHAFIEELENEGASVRIPIPAKNLLFGQP